MGRGAGTVKAFARGGPAERHWLLQRTRARLFSRWVARSFRAFGEESVLWLPVTLWGAERISLGSRVRVAPGCRLSTDRGGHLQIGDGSNLMGDVTVHATQEVVIGRKVLIARGVTVVDYSYRFDDRERPIIDQGRAGSPVRIGDGAWLGAGAVVLPGVSIGRNAVIGAGAVVRSDVPDHAVAVGVPARVL